MGVSCRRRVLALWCNEEKSNSWAWVTGAGWRKLDDRKTDACTNLLAMMCRSIVSLLLVMAECRAAAEARMD